MDHQQQNTSCHTSPSFQQSIEPPVCDRINLPWLITQKNEQDGENPGDTQNIRGCSNGWVILSNKNNVMWSLWNPVTSKFIRLPPMVLKSNGDLDDDFGYCCLSCDPDDPSSILLLQRRDKPNLVFCRVGGGGCKRKKSKKWIEMSYMKQLKSLEDDHDDGLDERDGDDDDDILNCLTCSNGKVYALTVRNCYLIHVDIVFRGKEEIVISLSRVREYPFPFIFNFNSLTPYYYLKGYGRDLFCIILGFDEVENSELARAYLFRLDTTNATSTWEEIKDLKDAVFFVDHGHDSSVFYNHGVKLEGEDGEANYTIEYKLLKDITDEISVTFITNVDDDNDDDDDVVECNNSMTNESLLFNIPFHILERIMEFCVGTEFLKFRATCKLCHLAAPLMRLRDEAALIKLHAYSFASPLLMVVEENRDIISFTDPILDDKYFMNTLAIASHKEISICCSKYGWLLFYSNLGYLVFFNPFTKDVRNLPTTSILLENLCFSAPPTSPNCVVVGFTKQTRGGDAHAYILRFATNQPLWHIVDISDAPYAFRYPTFHGRDIYALCNKGQLVILKEISEARRSTSCEVVAEAPNFRLKILTQYYLVKRDQHLLLVILNRHGGCLEVFELNDSTKEWKKIDSLGRHTIYISDTTCLCIETTTPKVQNKIYFPNLHTENGKIVFYSLETKSGYYAFDGDKIEATAWEAMFIGTKYHLNPYAWIEPSWC